MAEAQGARDQMAGLAVMAAEKGEVYVAMFVVNHFPARVIDQLFHRTRHPLVEYFDDRSGFAGANEIPFARDFAKK